MKPESKGFAVSTDPSLFDLDFVHRALNATYWAKNRPRSVVEESIRNSICFGVYDQQTKKQVGFARVVTDHATFSWLCDVIIDDGHRNKGLGKMLMSAVTAHPSVRNTVSLLGTLDAHGLYEKFGYTRSEQMKRLPKK